jgi:UDP-N-acetylmuramoylalanine--D-glutamate ligase
VGEVLWINDSKATNVSAARVALQAMTRPYVVIMGGHPKGESFTPLAGAIGERCRAAVAYGEAAPAIERELSGAVELETVSSFDDAVRRAAELARPGDAVLLSPACASFDQFSSYVERGERFRNLAGAA